MQSQTNEISFHSWKDNNKSVITDENELFNVLLYRRWQEGSILLCDGKKKRTKKKEILYFHCQEIPVRSHLQRARVPLLLELAWFTTHKSEL
jgi:hypothetical protein